MSSVVPEKRQSFFLSDLVSRIRTIEKGKPKHILTISSTQGWVDQRERWSREMAGESLKKYTKLRKGDFSYNKGNSKTFPYGCIFRLDKWDEAVVPNVYHSFAISNDQVNSDYLQQYFWSGGLDKQLRKVLTSSVRDNGLLNITSDTFFSLLVELPPLPEQKKIASILTSVDEVIENTQKQIDKLQDLKKATMNELLTKGIGHTEFKDSELGRIPRSWEVVRFDEISSQKTLGTAERGGLVDKIPLIKMGDLQFGNVIVGANETISKSKLTSENFLSKGDFLFNTRNTPELVGKVGNYNSSKLAAYDNNLLKIDFSEDMSSLFMGMQFNEFNVKKRLRRIVAGTTSVAAIYWNDLKKFYVLKPSMTEQNNIYAVFESIENQVKTMECKLSQTQSLKKSLMQDLLTGKVRVAVN